MVYCMDIQHLRRLLEPPWSFDIGPRDNFGAIYTATRTFVGYGTPARLGPVAAMAPGMLCALVRIAELCPPGDRAGDIARRAIDDYTRRCEVLPVHHRFRQKT